MIIGGISKLYSATVTFYRLTGLRFDGSDLKTLGKLVPDDLVLIGPTGVLLVVSFASAFPHCFISVFV